MHTILAGQTAAEAPRDPAEGGSGSLRPCFVRVLRSCVFMGLTRSGLCVVKGFSPPAYRQLPKKFDPKDLSL